MSEHKWRNLFSAGQLEGVFFWWCEECGCVKQMEVRGGQPVDPVWYIPHGYGEYPNSQECIR